VWMSEILSTYDFTHNAVCLYTCEVHVVRVTDLTNLLFLLYSMFFCSMLVRSGTTGRPCLLLY